MSRRGYTLIEVMTAVAIAAVLMGIGALALDKALGRARCDTRTMAETIAEQFRLARQQAIATRRPVTMFFATHKGKRASFQSYLTNRTGTVRVVDFSHDYPSGCIFVGYWELQRDHLEGPEFDNRRDGVPTPGNAGGGVSGGGGDEEDYTYTYDSCGRLNGGGAACFNRAWHLLISEGAKYEPAPPPPPSLSSKMQYYTPTRVCRPVTVSLYGSGAVTVTDGIADAKSDIVTLAGPAVRLGELGGGPGFDGMQPSLKVDSLQWHPKVAAATLARDALTGSQALVDEGAPMMLDLAVEDSTANAVTLTWTLDGQTHVVDLNRRGWSWETSIAWQPRERPPVPAPAATPSASPTPGATPTPAPPQGPSVATVGLTMQLSDDIGQQLTVDPQRISVRSAGRIFFYGEHRGEGWAIATDPSGVWTRPVAKGPAGYAAGAGQAVDYDTLAVSPDGQRLAFRGVDGMIYLCNRDGLGMRLFNGASGGHRDLCWSPDGCHLAYVEESGGEGKIFLASADGSCARPLFAGHQPHWSPDGRCLSYVAPDDGGEVLRCQALDASCVAVGDPVPISGHGPTHNLGWVGQRAFYTQGEGALLYSGGPRMAAESWGFSAVEGCCSQRQLAYIEAGTHTLHMLTPDTKSAALILDEVCQQPCFSPAGDQLVFSKQGTGLFRIDSDGRNLQPFPVIAGSRGGAFPHWVR